MAKSRWTVAPETDRLEFEIDGEKVWIVVKRQLTIGEQRRVDSAAFRSLTTQPAASGKLDAATGEPERESELTLDWRGQSFARTLAYLLDWSLQDDADNKLKIESSTVEALRQDVYKAIEDQINKHVAARVKEKNGHGGGDSPKAT